MSGEDLRAWRERRDWGQIAAADFFAVDQSRWSKWERGEAPVPRYVARALELAEEVERLRAGPPSRRRINEAHDLFVTR